MISRFQAGANILLELFVFDAPSWVFRSIYDHHRMLYGYGHHRPDLMNEPIGNQSTTDRIGHNGRQRNGDQGWYTGAKKVLTNELLIADGAKQRLTLKARGEEVRELNYVLGHLPHYDVSDRLIECFSEAGLPQPDLFCETPVGGGIDSPLYEWVAETLQSFLPRLAQMGIAFGEPVGIETLGSRLRDAAIEARSQIVAPGQLCAWSRI